MRLPPLPTITDIVRLYKLRAKKQLAQNFLLDMNLCHKIAHKAGSLEGHRVLEVGPGPGGITRAIFEAGAKEVHVVEKDRRFLPGLELLKEAADDRLVIHHADILRFDVDERIPFDKSLTRDWSQDPPPFHVIGNLPFNVSTPLIIKYLKAISERKGLWKYGRVPLTLTFQQEVAERMVAPVRGTHRCRLSITCQYLCDVQYKFHIPGRAFVPAPDVDVGVVKFIPRVTPLIQLPFDLVDKVIRHVFHFRQKHIKRGIQTLFPAHRTELTAEMLVQSEVGPTSRCTGLLMEEVNALCHVYARICAREPEILTYDYRAQENAKIWRDTISKKLYLD